jgi:LysR family transcriptional activator of glutamate synthase operon
MQLISIKFFLAVVISGTFTQAAEVMYTTQSTVSKQINALEKELGVLLFDRSKRKVTLTSAGNLMLEHAEKLLDSYNEMAHAMEELSSRHGNQTALASIPVMAHYGIIALISEFRTSHPNFNLIVDECEASDIIQGMKEKQYEMAFMRSMGIDQAKYQRIVLFTDRLAALLPAGHPLADQKSISIRQLRNETFLLLGKRTSLYDYCVNACKQHGDYAPNIGFTGTHMENIVEMVGQGMGVSLMMETPAGHLQKGNTRLVALKEEIVSQVILVRLRRLSPTVVGDSFWSYIRDWSARRVTQGADGVDAVGRACS